MPDRFEQLAARLERSTIDQKYVREVLNGGVGVRGVSVEVERQVGERKAPNGADYHVKIRASTSGVARDAGIIPMEAWQKGGLANFTRNPIILAFHDHKQPIGISVHTELNHALDQYWLFHEESEISRLMRKLYEKGFMRAASVGFLVKEFEIIDEKEEQRLQKELGITDPIFWRALDAELLETSAVPVPSDAGALVLEHAIANARALGLDVKELVAHTNFRSTQMPDDNKSTTEGTPKAEATIETPAGTPAESQPAQAPAISEERFAALENEVKELREKIATPAPATASTPATEEFTDDIVSISIEMREGESEEDALARYIDETLASGESTQ